MKKAQPRTKKKKEPNRSFAVTANKSKPSQPISQSDFPLPTAEWVVEMATRLLFLSNVTAHQTGIKWVVACHEVLIGLREAHAALKAEQHFRSSEAERQQLFASKLSSLLSPKERKLGKVSFAKGCKIITGDTKRLRAESKWRAFEPRWNAGNRRDGIPVPNYEVEGFGLVELTMLMRSY